MEIIDLTAFEKVLNSLNEVIEVYNSDKTNLITINSIDEKFKNLIQDSLVELK